MGATSKNSVRQRILRLEVCETAVFPVERADYVASMAYRVGKCYKRKYTCPTTENRIKVTRLQ